MRMEADSRSDKRETKLTIQKPKSFVDFGHDRRNMKTPGQLIVNNHPEIFCRGNEGEWMAIDGIKIYGGKIQETASFSGDSKYFTFVGIV